MPSLNKITDYTLVYGSRYPYNFSYFIYTTQNSQIYTIKLNYINLNKKPSTKLIEEILLRGTITGKYNNLRVPKNEITSEYYARNLFWNFKYYTQKLCY